MVNFDSMPRKVSWTQNMDFYDEIVEVVYFVSRPVFHYFSTILCPGFSTQDGSTYEIGGQTFSIENTDTPERACVAFSS